MGLYLIRALWTYDRIVLSAPVACRLPYGDAWDTGNGGLVWAFSVFYPGTLSGASISFGIIAGNILYCVLSHTILFIPPAVRRQRRHLVPAPRHDFTVCVYIRVNRFLMEKRTKAEFVI